VLRRAIEKNAVIITTRGWTVIVIIGTFTMRSHQR
jgi:hypothetical protein